MPPKTAAHLFPVEEPAETPFYIAATQQAVDPAAARAQIWRHLHRARQPRRHHGDLRRLGRPVPSRHPLSVAARIAGQRRASAAARLQPARRQFGLFCRPDQSRSDGRPAHRAGEGHRAYFAHDVPVARHRLSAARRAQLRRRRRRLADLDPVRERFCRPVRSARRAPRTPRHGDGQSARRRPGAADLSRPRQQGAAHRADLRSAAEPADDQRRGLRVASRTRRNAAVVPGGELRCRRRAAAAVHRQLHCRAPRIARGDPDSRRRSKRRTSVSTKCCAARPPISPC